MMKRIAAFISPQKISEVKDTFEKAGYPRNTIHCSYLPPNGSSKYKGRVISWQGSEYVAVPIEKIMMELIVADKDVENVRRILIEKAHTNGGNGTSEGRFEYALIPKNKMNNIKSGEKVQYTNTALNQESLEVVQITL